MAKKTTQKLLEELDERIEKVKSSEKFKEIMEFFSKNFHNYSYKNILLIQMQCPNAKLVKGYKQWKELDRYVLPREKRKEKREVRTDPIRILAPQFYFKTVKEINKSNQEEIKKAKEKAEQYSTYKIEEKNNKVILKQEKTYFKYVNVYDISQTAGKPIPSMDLNLKDNFGRLLQPLHEFSSQLDIDVEFKTLSEDLRGYSKKDIIVIDSNSNDTEKTSVWIHELAHELLHNKEDRIKLSREIKEMEAEAVSFIVMKHYDIEIKSDKYLALYKKDYNLKKSLKRIHQVSTKIIEYCDNWLADENEKEMIV